VICPPMCTVVPFRAPTCTGMHTRARYQDSARGRDGVTFGLGPRRPALAENAPRSPPARI
jgi:hypothetical protein